VSRSFPRLFPRTRQVRLPGTGLRRVPPAGPATARQPAFDTRLAEGGIVQVRPAHPGT